MSWETTRALIEKSRVNDRGAFDELVVKYASFVETYLHAQVGTRLRRKFGVDDMVQETFLRAYLGIRHFRGETIEAFQSWLRTIARHTVHDHARRFASGRRSPGANEISLNRASSTSSDLDPPADGRVASPEKTLRRNERFDQLQQALDNLSPDHREVIYKARIKCLPIKTIAESMDRSEAAVSMLLLRALLKLKAAFGDTESLDLPKDRSLETDDPGPPP